MKEMKRIVALVLCLVMLVGYLPVGAQADEVAPVQEPSAITDVVVEEAAAEAEENDEESLTPDTGDPDPADGEVVSEENTTSEEETPAEDNTAGEETPAAEEATEEAAAFVLEEVTFVAPMTNADNLIDAAIFCSDVHGSTSDLTNVMGGVAKSGVDYSAIGFVGDTCLTVANTTSIVQSALGDTDIAVMFSYASSHDTEGEADIDENWDYSGEVEGVSENYLVYTIREDDMKSDTGADEKFTTWYNGLTDAEKALPIFIMSHRPLHARRNDNNGAAGWYSAISAAAETSDIVFFWAHNHTSESSVDTAAYYVAKDGTESFTVYNGDTVFPNFTYMNAGYINAANQNPARLGVATTVQITADSLIFRDYNSSGTYSGTYAHNVEVAREFAASTDSGETVTLKSIAVTTAPTKTVYNVGDTFSSEGLVVTATYSDGTTADVTEFVELSEVDMTTAGAKTVQVAYGEDNVVVETSFEITVNEVVADDAVLSGIEITTLPTTQTYEQGSQLNLAGMVVTATFEDGSTVAVTDYEVTGYNANTLGEQTITVSYTHGEGDAAVTKTATFTVTVTEPSEETSNEVTVGGTTTTTKTVYVLTSSISSGNAYLVVNGNSAGSYYALANNSGSVAATGVTVKTDSTIGTYIELSDATDELWTVSGSNSTTLKNGSHYLYGSGSDLSLSTSNSRTWSWSSSNSRLSYTSGSGRNQKTYYLVYGDSGWDTTQQSDNIYFYVPTEVKITTDSTVKYTMRAEDLKQVVDSTNTATLSGQIDFCLQGNGSDLTTLPSDGSYSFSEVSDADNIIDSIGTDGTVNFTGATGTATVKVAYTWTQDGETYTVYKHITVEATSPYYTLDLHKADANVEEVTGLNAWVSGTTYYTKNEDGTYTKVDTTTTPDSTVTYYAVTYTLGDEITNVISIKGIEAGDQYGVWAVVKYYDGTTEAGTDMGSVANDIEWSSSDENVATVDPISGIITFTGKDGTVNITATYKNGNKPADTITISVTQQQYNVPADGTTDFPEYPNEGAIRYDKTATAVGNFSETGIAQLELSMTGVPYTTGSETDVVLMLDMTGSMSDTAMVAAEEAAVAFVAQIVKNEDGSYNDNRIAVYAFNSGSSSPYTLVALGTIDSDSELESANTAIRTASDKQVSGGTPYDEALEKCQSVLAAAKTDGIGNDRQQFCVFMSDGGPTSYKYITNYDAVKAGTASAYTTASASASGGSNQSDSNFATIATYTHEYYSTLMKDAGVTMFSVLTGLKASSYPNCATIMENIASSSDNAYVVENGSDTSAVSGALSSVAQKILQAATDVTVEDKITDEYTMIFDIPEGTEDITGVTNDFYIEFLKYTLDATNHERVDADNDGDTYDDATSVTKLYLKNTNGTLSAAKDSTGAAYDAPVFANAPIGDKGTLYYWTTDSGYASKAALSYTSGSTTYYFIPYGIKATDDGYDAAKWFNMTSGGYASGTVNADTNMSTDLVIATPYFVYNADTKMIYWTLDKLENATTEYALRYFLYLNKSATEVGTANETDPGSYPTNDHAYITYTNFQKHECRQEFPIPQLTWSGAQVSYVFYLVNAAGQPINKSGQVVDFANATFVTDVYTENTVWNKGEDGKITADSKLSIDWLAANLLPSDYKVYDEAAKYQLHVFGDHTGESIFDYFIIDGNDATTISNSLNERLESVNTTASTVSLTTTKVYNTKAGTKITGYGTYTSEATSSLDGETVLEGFDFYNTTVAFAVVWQPALAPDTIVVDYGLDVLINVTFNDLMQDNTISGIGLSRNAYGSIAENTGISTTSKLGTASLNTEDGSTISIEPNNVQIRFSQNDMTFEKPVTFYYESAVKYYESSEQKEGYLHSSVTVIPATTIYYEDEFVKLTTYKDKTYKEVTYTETSDNSIVYYELKNGAYNFVLEPEIGKNYYITSYNEVDGWPTDSAEATATQAQDRPGTTQITGVIDANNNYGYDAAYSEMSTYSMGSAASITVNANTYGTASFEFYGTGFDIISLSDTNSGSLVVDVYPADKTTAVKNLVVDTYFGYKKNDDGNWIITDKNDPNALYQVPVMKVDGLKYGKYRAELRVAYDTLFDHNESSNETFWLDAVRIYDPAGSTSGEIDDTIEDAYAADGELFPKYYELRNWLIAAKDFSVLENTDTVNGIVFIDSKAENNVIDDYSNYGPNNELYLDAGQAVSFVLNASADAPANYQAASVQMAMKSVGNGAAKVKIYDADATTADKVAVQEIKTATDLYYDITSLNGKNVVIQNASDAAAILSVTNVKVTYEQKNDNNTENGLSVASEENVGSAEGEGVFTVTSESASRALLSLRPVADEAPDESIPESSEPEASEPETSEPESSEPETSEPEDTKPQQPQPDEEKPQSPIKDTIKKVIKVFKNIFGKWF